MYKIREVDTSDYTSIFSLYKKVAANIGGISRVEDEITEEYVQDFIAKSKESGIQLVVFDENLPGSIVGEIHCYRPLPKVFSHVLTDLTIVVDPAFQRKGIGKLLFGSLLNTIKTKRTDILRLELIVRETNHKAISFYRSIDFRIEGRFERRIDSRNGRFESDIPMAWFNPEFDNPYFRK
jgi:ribosomal protein S18 acetylase RimI-like enzyme